MGGGIAVDGTKRGTDRLTELAIKRWLKQAQAGTASKRKLFDGGGLHLMLTPVGTPTWRIKFRIGEKEKVFSVGVYPGVSLQAARTERAAVQTLLREGRDPTKARQLSRAEAHVAGDTTFEGVTSAWLTNKKKGWSKIHFEKSRQALERDVLPFLGRLPIAAITTTMVATVIEKVSNRAPETAARMLWQVNGIFELAQAKGLCQQNPALPVRAVLTARKPHRPRPALLEFGPLGELLRRAELARLSPAVRMAHRLVAFTGARIGNTVTARWEEFDLTGDTPIWTVPRAQMKVNRGRTHDHRMILGPTIAAELTAWKRLTSGRGYVFPSPAGGSHITREALEKAYRSEALGVNGKHSVHGWRASFSTLAREAGFAREVVELALDHIHDTEVARVYDRGERIAERVKLFYWWDAQLVAAQHGTTPMAKGKAGAA